MKPETITRFYVERNAHFQEENTALKATLERDLGITLAGVRIVHRYYITDVEGIKRDPRFRAILAQPQSDLLFEKFISYAPQAWVLARESLPGQYDQRADSLAQSIEVITGARPKVQVATLFIFEGALTPEMKGRITDYLINPIDSRVAHLDKPTTLAVPDMPIEAVPVIKGLIKADEEGLKAIKHEWALSCDLADLKEIQRYFRDEEGRDPTLTECRVLDTYWSDHCRHTTFNTAITLEASHDPRVSAAYERYLAYRQALYSPEKLARKPISLMDMATIAAKRLIREGVVKSVDQSEEINACCVRTTLQTSVGPQPWLYYFKNETHNHPTEIEPFGGAATCLGGAIRDPLSGRAYVYQGCRVTGAANPLVEVTQTRPGKRSQRQICQLAAKGFASYGNQIGMATGLVDEVYHPGYEAKRMEVGAVVGAAPACNVVRETPRPGDWVVLVGGRTGRDGCGGATGSSQTHSASTIETAGAEVQKGNAVEERKLQRLFRDPELAPKIIRCNDFGAGGIAVSVGELADGVEIYLDRMPKKYQGLNPTELAISESQERMSCVIHPEDWECFKAKAEAENLEATVVATITEAPVLVMRYGDETLVHLERSFLESAGAPKSQTVIVDAPKVRGPRPYEKQGNTFESRVKALMTGLNHCSKKGLIEQFDSTIGGNTVLMPLGGKTQSTPSQVMAAKFPLLKGETQTCSVFTYGFDPYETETDPYQGSYDALVLSVMKLIAAGVPPTEVYCSLQEYFPSLRGDAHRWGRPMAAILGAMDAQCDLGVPAIGGKDSMSGSYEMLDVPATLISFATAITEASELRGSELKGPGHKLVRVDMPLTAEGRLDPEGYKRVWAQCEAAKRESVLLSGWAITSGGMMEALLKMAFGNDIGFTLDPSLSESDLFEAKRGSLVFETMAPLAFPEARVIGETIEAPLVQYGDVTVSLLDVKDAWENVLEVVYPREATSRQALLAARVPMVNFTERPSARAAGVLTHRPKAVIAVFPGTNCEVDTARSLTLAGADVETVIIANQTPSQLMGSVDRLEKALLGANMMVLPGGFSFGDEPDGSGKFIATFLRHERLAGAIESMLYARDGLMLGICNGFQALVKLGLLPTGHITQGQDTMPTLTFNRIGRHHSGYVQTRISSVYSPWLMGVNCGDVHSIAVSHGEGRLAASNPKVIEALLNAGQVATQYVDSDGAATMAFPFNPNGSTLAVEGLISPDGRILGKMGHSERRGESVAINIPGQKDQHLFESGVAYFTGKAL